MASLSGVLPSLALAYSKLLEYAATKGIVFGMADFGGIRTQADTTKILNYRAADYAAAVNAGKVNPDTMPIDTWRPIAPFGLSYHNYGAAFDVKIIARPSSMTNDQALAVLGAYAPTLGLRWGGTFSTKRQDPPHFELAQTLDAVKQQYALMTGSVVSGDDALGYSYDPSAVDDFSTWDAISDDYDDDIATGGSLVDAQAGATVAVIIAVGVLWWAWKRRTV